MADRYFVDEPISGPQTRLEDEEAHHLAHVMRARAGDEATIFDGSGAEWQARVVHVGRNSVELEVIERRDVDRELPIELTLAVALPKGERQRWLVEKAVELGVSRLVPMKSERGVAQPVDKAFSRLRRAVVEASKQCGRNRLMDIAAPAEFGEIVACSPAADAIRAVVDPHGTQSAGALLAATKLAQVAELTWLIGPEGGFTEQELETARAHHWPIIDLGPRILRVETAAVFLAAVSAEHCESTRRDAGPKEPSAITGLGGWPS